MSFLTVTKTPFEQFELLSPLGVIFKIDEEEGSFNSDQHEKNLMRQ